MPLRKLDPKPNAPVINSGHLEAHLKAAGVTVGDGGVTGHTDGSVEVDTLATTALQTAWDAYTPPPPPPPPATKRQQLRDAAQAATTLAEFKVFIRDQLIPAVVRDEP
jgi:hypothetical protein